MKAEYRKGCLQRDSVEREEYAGAQSVGTREGEERDGASNLLERILNRDNLNRAYRQVKRNHGAPGIDKMTIEEALPWLKEHKEELLSSIRDGKYKPKPVRRKEIPKPDGSGVRKLGIPTVIDRIIQQAIAQQLQTIFEPLFSDGSYGYRPKRSAQQAILKVKEYAEQGYTHAVEVDLSKYFDTLNHELLMHLLCKQIHDKRVTDLIKKYLKSGVMETVKVYIRGWIGYYYVADMKRILQSWNEWLRRRFRMYIWKQWKKPKTKVQNLRKLGVPDEKAYQWGNSRLGYWRITGSAVLQRSITNEKLALAGYFDFLAQYEQFRKLHLCD